MNLTDQQATAVSVEGRALLVEAGAGTGKTSVLTERFLNLLERHPDWPLESIIAVTFTEKATREMRSRIRQGVEARAREAPPNSPWHGRRRDLDRLQVSTIHSLCARILRENSIAAGIDPKFEVLDEQEADVQKEEAIRQALAELAAPSDDSPSSSATTNGSESTGATAAPLDLLAGLQIRDVREELSRLMAMRGTVTRLFMQLPDGLELLGRWRTGFTEMQQAVWREMFSSDPEMRRVLTAVPAIVIADPDDKLAPAVLLAQEGCRRLEQKDIAGGMGCFAEMNRVGGRAAAWGGKEALAELKADLGVVQAAGKQLLKDGITRQVGPVDEAAAVALIQWRALWERVAVVYDRLKAERQALDFDDLELLADRLLRRTPRDSRLATYLASIRHVMVDEFQDVNELQGEIIYALAHPSDGGRFFAVGDAKQSIYRFRQAQVSVFNRAARDIEKYTGYPPLPLNCSFRAHSELVAALNDAFDRILRPIGEIHADFEARPGRLTYERLTPARHAAASARVEVLLVPSAGGAQETRRCEAAILAERLLALQRERLPVWDRHVDVYRPFRFDDAAILFRATTSLPIYEEEFKAAGLPYLTVSGRGYYNRPEVRDLIALLASLRTPGDDLSLATVLRSPLFNLSDETLYRLRWMTSESAKSAQPAPFAEALAAPPFTDQPDEAAFAAGTMAALRSMVGRVDVWRLLRAALDRTGYEAALALSDAADNRTARTGKAGRSRSNVAKFLALARERGGTSLSDFLRWVEDLQAREAREGEAPAGAPDAGAVQLMSVHAAKGLEFPVVVVADLGRGLGHGGKTPRILHDPEFGVVCQLRNNDGDWIKPASYLWAEWLNERMELAESRRLLYVACTRAADLLILSGAPGEPGSWLATLADAWNLPVGAEDDSRVQRDGYSIRLCCPVPTDEDRTAFARPKQATAGLAMMPPLARPLSSTSACTPIAVTHLQRRLAEDAGELPVLRPAVIRGRDASRPRQAPAYLVGNLMHRALADWDCLASPPDERRRKLAAWALRAGIAGPDALDHMVDCVLGMLYELQRMPFYHEIVAASERYAEIPFSLESPVGILHGIIDLLFRDGSGGWRLVDWKTEPIGRGQTLAEAAQPHLLQMAVYARAAERILGIRPYVEICFLSGRVGVYRCKVAELDTAWNNVMADATSI